MKFYLFTITLFMALLIQAQNGVLDQNFNAGGKMDLTHETANSICTDKNNKILVLGHTTTGNRNIFVHRYHADGSADNSFGSNGRFLHDLNSDFDFGRCIKVLDNGKYLVCGQNSTGPFYRTYVLRLNSNGSKDSSFGSNGVTIISPNQGNCDAWSMEISETGSIYLAGYRTVNGTYKSVVWKLKPNGSIDAGFGSSGEKLINTTSGTERLYGIDLNENLQTLAVCGISENGSGMESIVALLDTNGNLKTSFNSNGYKKIKYHSNYTYIYDISLSDNQVLVAGDYSDSGKSKALLCALALDGTLKTGFGNSGYRVDGSSPASSYKCIVMNCEGDYFAGGYAHLNSKSSFRVSKYSANGQLLTHFASSGHFTTRIKTGNSEYIEAIALYGNTSIVFGGRTNMEGSISHSGIVKLNVAQCNASGLETLNTNAQISVYPNPLKSGEVLYLRLDGVHSETDQVALYNMDGKLLFQCKYDHRTGVVLPEGFNLSPGIYQILVIAAEKLQALSLLVD